MGDDLSIEWRAFPLRPVPDPSAAFKGTYREASWRRCGAMAEPDGIAFNPWPRDDYPGWSLPALEVAKCVARQGAEAFDRLHLRLYEAIFTRGINIARQDELLGVAAESGADLPRLARDLETGGARDEVMQDYETAVTELGIRAIPTVIVAGRARLTGLVELAAYREAIEGVS